MTSVRAGAYGLALAGLAIAAGPSPARTLGGLALVLVLPGFALTCLAGRGTKLDRVEQVLAVLGLSIVIAVVGGLAIAGLGIPLTRASFALGLYMICGAALAAAALTARRAEPAADVLHTRGLPAVNRTAAGLLAAAVLVTAASIWIGVALQADRGPGFTQLWALREGSGSVQVGVRSHEKNDAVYRLRVSGGAAGRREAVIGLRPGQQWIARRALLHTRGVTVTLAKAGRHGVYRRVHLSPQTGF